LGLERGRRERFRDRSPVPGLRGRRRAHGVSRRLGRYGPRRMALRHLAGARLRRFGRGRPRLAFATVAVVVYAAAGVSATSPAVLHAPSDFLSGGAPGHGEASAGDHLQTLYHWWLVGHQLEHGHAPWLDPYSFRPEASAQPNFPGWPYGFLFWPLGAVLGPVVAWNAMQLLLYVLAGVVTFAWLRELGLPRGAATAAAVAAGILVRQTVIEGSTQAGGRSLDEVRFNSARWGDFLARNVDHARSEQFVYLGWATPLLALAGLVVLLRARRFGLAVVL